jgi:biopolymer transport protein ExbB/TolQ
MHIDVILAVKALPVILILTAIVFAQFRLFQEAVKAFQKSRHKVGELYDDADKRAEEHAQALRKEAYVSSKLSTGC